MKTVCLTLLLIAFLLTSQTANAQNILESGVKTDANVQSERFFGIETDYLAFRIGEPDSYLICGWYGREHFKYSLLFAKIDYAPEHEIYEDADSESDIAAFRVDYFWNENLKGFWLGGAVVFEKTELVYHSERGSLNTISLGVSGGYSYHLTDRFYVAPYLNILVPVERRKCVVDGKEFKNASWGLEPGIKIGFVF
jgi:hypothetical protein